MTWNTLASDLSGFLNNKFINDDVQSAIKDAQEKTNTRFKATPEELSSALEQVKKNNNYGNLGSINTLEGVDPLKAIEDLKRKYGFTTDKSQQDTFHQQADTYRKLAAAKGIDLNGYTANDPLKTPDYSFEQKPLFKPGQGFSSLLGGVSGEAATAAGDNVPTQAPDGYPAFNGSLASFYDNPQTAQISVSQGAAQTAPLSSNSSTADQGNGTLTGMIQQGMKTNLDFQRPQEQSKIDALNQMRQNMGMSPVNNFPAPNPNALTFDDIDKASGGEYSRKMQDLAARVAKERAYNDINSGNDTASFLASMLAKGYRPEAIKQVLPIYSGMVDKAKAAEVADLGSQMAAKKDPAARLGLMLKMNEVSGGDAGSKFLAGLLPSYNTTKVDTGDATNIVSVQTPSPLGFGNAETNTIGTYKTNLSPGQVQQGNQFNAQLKQNWQIHSDNVALQEKQLNLNQQKFAVQVQAMRDANKPAAIRQRALEEARKIQSDIIQNYSKMLNSLDPTGDSTAPYVVQMRQSLAEEQKKIKMLGDAALGDLGFQPQSQPQGGGNNGQVDYNEAIQHITDSLKRNASAPENVRWNKDRAIQEINDRYGDLAPYLINDTDWKAFGL